jgi:hypothetical protein
VVPVATVPRERKEDILVLVVADPVSATVRLDQSARFAAQAATGFLRPRLGCALWHVSPFSSNEKITGRHLSVSFFVL